MKCSDCGTEMVLMISSSFCPNDCDRDAKRGPSTQDCVTHEWWWTVANLTWINSYLADIGSTMHCGGKAFADGQFCKERKQAINIGRASCMPSHDKFGTTVEQNAYITKSKSNVISLDGAQVLKLEYLRK